jgi:CubicO group peptidase (beta-lactamase class C family)
MKFRAGLFALSILSAVLPITRVALREAQGSTEAPLPPGRTSLSDPGVLYTVPDKGYVVLRRGEIEAVIADNRAVDDEVLPGHRAGYHGVAALRSGRDGQNLFVPAYSGLNLEHIHDGTTRPREILFEPRQAPMELRAIDQSTAELYQPPTPTWGLESCLRYEILDDGTIEMTFECVPRRDTFRGGYLGLFWASYIDRPQSLDVHFRGAQEGSGATAAGWLRGFTPKHGEAATHRAIEDLRNLPHDADFPLELPFGFSRLRYAEPWFYGVCRGAAFLQLFRNEDDVRLTQSPSGGGPGCPAWDFQWIVESPRVGRRYQLVMRAAYVPVSGKGESEEVHGAMARLAAERAPASSGYFPPPESQGGWRKLENPEAVRKIAGMDPEKVEGLRKWLLESDDREFAAVVIRRGHIVLEVERGRSSRTDAQRVASVSKAVCATVLAIASERSRAGLTPKLLRFEDPAFPLIPWAYPLSDPRKASITVRQLLNHTSGICPEATGAPNDGPWEYILGLSGDQRTARLAFDPGTAAGYSTHALAHAALICETATGMPYDRFAIEALFRPLGIEHWWFQHYTGREGIGDHPSHGLGMPARDLARIGYALLRGGRWAGRQVIPLWFVNETAEATHAVTTPEMRWKLNPRIFSHGWELPARLTGEDGRSGEGIPADARSKPGSGGQLLAWIPSLDLVLARQTGSSGSWGFEEYIRRACAAVLER